MRNLKNRKRSVKSLLQETKRIPNFALYLAQRKQINVFIQKNTLIERDIKRLEHDMGKTKGIMCISMKI